jgi:hypothetical protein
MGEDLSLLLYDTEPLGDWFLSFQKIVVPSSSGAKQSKKIFFFVFQDCLTFVTMKLQCSEVALLSAIQF